MTTALLVVAALYVFTGEVFVVIFIAGERRSVIRRWSLHTLPLLFIIGALTWPKWVREQLIDSE